MTDKLLELELESLNDGLLSSHRFFKKPVVIFNSASRCGFTRQFRDFQDLYKSGKLIPIALPTNEFGNQEPGDNYELLQFCKTNFDVTFPVCKKTKLDHVLFARFGRPDWNFNKYLFNRHHEFVKKFDANFDPRDLIDYV